MPCRDWASNARVRCPGQYSLTVSNGRLPVDALLRTSMLPLPIEYLMTVKVHVNRHMATLADVCRRQRQALNTALNPRKLQTLNPEQLLRPEMLSLIVVVLGAAAAPSLRRQFAPNQSRSLG